MTSASEMTCIVSSGALNSTHSLTHSEMTYIVSGAWGVKLDSLTHPCLFAVGE